MPRGQSRADWMIIVIAGVGAIIWQKHTHAGYGQLWWDKSLEPQISDRDPTMQGKFGAEGWDLLHGRCRVLQALQYIPALRVGRSTTQTCDDCHGSDACRLVYLSAQLPSHD